MKLKKNIPDEFDGYLIYGDINNAEFRYVTGFTTSDPLTCLILKKEKNILLVSDMEKERATMES